MKSLILYSTIVGAFFTQSDAIETVIKKARSEVGDDVWKRGYSGWDEGGATLSAKNHLTTAQIHPVSFEGELIHVGFVENRDASGNLYPKLRVGVQNLDDQFLLSLDLKSDVAQRLIVKLDNCQPGEYIRVSAWPTVVEKEGRKFVNHAASMKDANSKEIPPNSLFSIEVKKQTDSVDAALRAVGVTDKKVIATAKANKRVEAHKDLLFKIQSRFVASTAAA